MGFLALNHLLVPVGLRGSVFFETSYSHPMSHPIAGVYEGDADPLPLSTYAKEVTFDDVAQLAAFLGAETFRRGRWIFRGQSDATWPLQPSLERLAGELGELPSTVELFIDAEFRRNAHHYGNDLPGPDDGLGWLALMRHHGAPTRLLDFSRSPYVAAFFATVDARPDRPSVIWAANGSQINHHAGSLLAKHSMGYAVKQHGQRCLDNASYSFSDPAVFKDVFEGGTLRGQTAVPARVVVPVEPRQTNQRALLQQGMFLCPVTLFATFEAALKNVVRHANGNGPDHENILYKIWILPEAHAPTLRELHRMNISYATLVPGLDGLARTLATLCKIRAKAGPSTRPNYEFGSRF